MPTRKSGSCASPSVYCSRRDAGNDREGTGHSTRDSEEVPCARVTATMAISSTPQSWTLLLWIRHAASAARRGDNDCVVVDNEATAAAAAYCLNSHCISE